MEPGNLNHHWNEIVTEGSLALGGSVTFKSQRPRCLRIFSITGNSRMTAMVSEDPNFQISFHDPVLIHPFDKNIQKSP